MAGEAPTRSSYAGDAASEFRFPRGKLPRIVAWPAFGLVLCTILWSWVAWRIEREATEAEQKGLLAATEYCSDYAKTLSQLLESANQTVLQLQFNWKQSHGKLELGRLAESGMYRAPQIVNVLVMNRDGAPLTALTPIPKGINYADRDFFQFHKNDPSDRLLISKRVIGKATQKPIVPISRRLSTADGSFAGVVMAALDPSYLTAFYAGSFPGDAGLLAVAGLDGTLRSSKIGGSNEDAIGSLLQSVPLFETPDGAQRLAGETWFRDGTSRYVAWKTLQDYPLVVMAGLSEPEFLAPYQQDAADYRKMAMAGSIVLLLLAGGGMAAAVRHARRQYEEEEVQRAYRVATDGANEGFYMFEAVRGQDGGITDFKLSDCNERGAEFYGKSRDQLIGQRFSILSPEAYFDGEMETFLRALETGYCEDELDLARGGGRQIGWAKRRVVRSGRGLAVTLLDITERKAAEDKIAFLAHHDSLTGLPNRILLHDRFAHAMAIAGREETRIALMFLDLDHFKHINDSYGHQVGDKLLIQVVSSLKGCIRNVDTICRLGGDEFIILLADIKDVSDISRVAQCMLEEVAKPTQVQEHEFHISASIGIAISPDDGNDFDVLLRNADTAMYQTKETGRNLYRFFTPKMNVEAQARLQLHNKLHVALQRQEFHLHYQPQVELRSGRIIGMEALIRWYHPEEGVISPSQFIPAAESSGLIIPIGDWVLQEACRQARSWSESGHNFRVAVNLSALQFKRGNILEKVTRALVLSGLSPGHLELELTESILLDDMETALSTIHQLKALGVQLSIDDFGTGYSSLSYLKQLKVDKLKIDQSFVRNIAADPDDLAIVRAIIQMGKTMQLKVIAEGVETADQVPSLRESGCDEGQGYYFCRPLPVADLNRWVEERA